MVVMPTAVVLIPALLSEDVMYRELIEQLGDTIEAQVMVLSEPTMQANVEAVLAKAPPRFVLAGTSYGGSIALEVALAAPERVTALWLMGCSPAAPEANVRDLVDGLEAMPDTVIDMLAGLAVPKAATEAAEVFSAMARRLGGKMGANQARALGARAEVTSRLGALRMPALVVWGRGGPDCAGLSGPGTRGCAAARAFPCAAGVWSPADAGEACRMRGAVCRVPRR